MQKARAPITPDGRYFVVRGRLWRCLNPLLDEARRTELVSELMSARRAKQVALRAGDLAAREAARSRVDSMKLALGERGPVWWDDGAADLNRHLARTTPYAAWFDFSPVERLPRAFVYAALAGVPASHFFSNCIGLR